MARTYLGGRIVASRRYALLAVGDLLAVLLFAVLGELRHAGSVATVVETTVQFGVGWAVVAPLVGAYGPSALDGWRRAARLGAGAWTVATVVGVLVRYLTESGASLSPVFVVVTVGVGVIIFGIWRAGAATWIGRR